jgi:phage repressor protein C with HTH and peptisase S24 domain
MEEFSEILIRERKKRNISKSAMAGILGMSERMYIDYESGKFKGTETKIKNYLNNLFSKKEVDYHNGNLVPVYDVDFSAGFGINSEFSGNIVGYIDLMGFRSCTAFIFVKGNSMEPKYINGDKIGLEPIESKRIDYGHDYAIVLTDGTKLVKKIRISKDPQKVKLEPINLKEYDAFEVEKNEIYLLFKVHGPIRDGAY